MDRPVELVRLQVEDNDAEEDAEERDVTTVFPHEGQIFKSEATEQVRAAVSDRFVTETQLHEAKESGLATRPSEGNHSKSLAVVLAENKRAKDDAFEEQWKTMKQGKNRPLDAEDFAFVDAVYQQEADKTKAEFDTAEQDRADFKKAREKLPTTGTRKSKASVKSAKKKSSLGLKPISVKVVPKKRSASDRGLTGYESKRKCDDDA